MFDVPVDVSPEQAGHFITLAATMEQMAGSYDADMICDLVSALGEPYVVHGQHFKERELDGAEFKNLDAKQLREEFGVTHHLHRHWIMREVHRLSEGKINVTFRMRAPGAPCQSGGRTSAEVLSGLGR